MQETEGHPQRIITLLEEHLEPNSIISEISVYLIGKLDLLSQIDCLSEYIIEQEIIYYADTDDVCLIVDRDPGNFSEKKYIEVSQKCVEKKFRLFVSNPTFEFWLLLHKNDVFSFDEKELLENAWHGKRRYLEKILSELYNGYKKEAIKPERFIFDVRTAIKNEKHFCENIDFLKDNLGTNVGCLMNELIAT